ncbi:hypothetical protein [Embleya sp. AB8]
MEADEYLRAVTAAEPAWVGAVLADLTAGRPTWSQESPAALAESFAE